MFFKNMKGESAVQLHACVVEDPDEGESEESEETVVEVEVGKEM